MSIQIALETVTPWIAKQWLEANEANRPLGRTNVDTYAHAMRRGEWKVNGETIKFSPTGRLIDGQHRLAAVVRSGRTIETYVARGVPVETFETIDQGKKRLGSDLLALRGEKFSPQLSAAARWFVSITKQETRQFVTSALVVKTVQENPQLRFWTAQYHAMKCHFMPSMFIAVLSVAEQKHGREPILKFLTSVATGVNLSEGDPALVLRARFIEKNVRGIRIPELAALTYSIKAVNAFLTGKKLSFLRFSRDEEIPEIV